MPQKKQNVRTGSQDQQKPWPAGTNVYVPGPQKSMTPLKRWVLRPLWYVYGAGIILTLFCNGDWIKAALWPLELAAWLIRH